MTLGSHQRTIGKSQVWITPKWILDAIGPFDLDPCAADPRPWDCAKRNLTAGGLEAEWRSSERVWLNPPFHRYEVGKWIEKLSIHGYGMALIHARTEAAWFERVWLGARSVLFLADRIHFHYPDGRRAEANSGAPACLVAFSQGDHEILSTSGIDGYLVTGWQCQGAAA